MTKIICEPKYKFICDNCLKEVEYFDAFIEFNFGYGSPDDGRSGRLDLCTLCSQDLLKLIQNNYKNFKLTNNT